MQEVNKKNKISTIVRLPTVLVVILGLMLGDTATSATLSSLEFK